MIDKRLKYPKTIPTLWRLRFSRAKSQANYRGELWEFDIEDWYDYWQSSGVQDRIGRDLDSVVLIRRDKKLPWNRQNCVIVERRHQLWKLGRDNFGGVNEDITGYALYQGE